MFGLTTGPHFSNNNGQLVPRKGGFLSDNYGGYLSPAQTQAAKTIGRGIIAVELIAWADANAVPNQYSFFKDLAGARFAKDPEKAKTYQEHYNSMFKTIGNGRLDLNDFLAFPLNLYFKNSADRAVEKNYAANNNKGNNKNGNNGDNNNKGGSGNGVKLG